MKTTALAFASMHSRKIILTAMVLTLLAVGAAGEAAAHNPAGLPVPGCEGGADAVAAHNPNCHG